MLSRYDTIPERDGQTDKFLSCVSSAVPTSDNKKLSYRREAAPRDASCCWVFWLVAEGCSK